MKIPITICLVIVVISVTAIPVPEEWNTYKVKHGKKYTSKTEDEMRMNIYFKNKMLVEEFNEKHANGLKTFKLGLNKFADLTSEEFKKKMNGYKRSFRPENPSLYVAMETEDLPETVDWTKKGAVTAVKDQKQCGSCWAFSATGALEGQHYLKNGKLVSLSEQNLVDCSIKEGNEGCSGGWMDQGFQYVKDNGGIDTEESYPYKADDGNCKFNKSSVGATCTGYTDIEAGNESALKSAVANIGPIAVAIDAGEFSFQLYESGIYYEALCDPDELDHGVLAVGYGTENGHDYWLVKNSWGEDWGLNGYIKMTRNKNNNCGIATKASYPLV